MSNGGNESAEQNLGLEKRCEKLFEMAESIGGITVSELVFRNSEPIYVYTSFFNPDKAPMDPNIRVVLSRLTGPDHELEIKLGGVSISADFALRRLWVPPDDDRPVENFRQKELGLFDAFWISTSRHTAYTDMGELPTQEKLDLARDLSQFHPTTEMPRF